MGEILRMPAEKIYERELEILKSIDEGRVPEGWAMHPRSVLKFLVGGEAKGEIITPKYIGNDRNMEIAIATLLTDRSLLLIGEPGTAKSYVSELLTAAISGDSTKVIQGTAGTTEEAIRYSWNYAMLIAKGPSEEALVKSPMIKGMESGSIVRFEEISRCVSEVQDAMISILSEKNLVVGELGLGINAKRGFSVIATANTRDKGVNDMSSALKRRFNTIVLSVPKDLDTEVKIVKKRVDDLKNQLDIYGEAPKLETISKIVTIFRELRSGMTLDGTTKVQSPSGVLSTAEGISLCINAMALGSAFGNGTITGKEIAAGLQGAIIKDEEKDSIIFKDYIHNVMKNREDFKEIYEGCKEL